MCIAIVKPQGIDFPSYEKLKICCDNNPDGIGYSYTSKIVNNKIVKSFFDVDSFYQSLMNNTTKDDLVFIHFRYATHGEKNSKNCHPFYIYENGRILMHNGVLQLGKLPDGYSDSLFLSQIICGYNLILNDYELKKSNNKIAIMQDDCFYLYGTWIKNEDGCYFSNGSFKYSLKDEQKNNPNKILNFCDCCGEIGENYIETDVGYHFCSQCIADNKINIQNCEKCNCLTTDKICSKCSEKYDISLKYWY